MSNNTNIKQYQKLTMIVLKSWKILRTPASREEVQTILNDDRKDYLVIDWVGFNRKTSVDTFFEFVPDDMECFILSQPKDIQEKLRFILKDREWRWLTTNWTDHLRKIYESKYLSQ